MQLRVFVVPVIAMRSITLTYADDRKPTRKRRGAEETCMHNNNVCQDSRAVSGQGSHLASVSAISRPASAEPPLGCQRRSATAWEVFISYIHIAAREENNLTPFQGPAIIAPRRS